MEETSKFTLPEITQNQQGRSETSGRLVTVLHTLQIARALGEIGGVPTRVLGLTLQLRDRATGCHSLFPCQKTGSGSGRVCGLCICPGGLENPLVAVKECGTRFESEVPFSEHVYLWASAKPFQNDFFLSNNIFYLSEY